MAPFHTLPFRFRLEIVKAAFVTCHNTEQKNHSLLVDISAAVLRCWLFADLCGLRSISAGPNEHKLSYSLSFQSSPVLHCVLIQVFGLLCPQSHACRPE